MKVVNRGDQYVPEVAATANAVMERLEFCNRHVMAWQSQVGPLPWMGPQTGDVIQGLAKQGKQNKKNNFLKNIKINKKTKNNFSHTFSFSLFFDCKNIDFLVIFFLLLLFLCFCFRT